MDVSIAQARRELAPTGRLRAAINRGNAVLVQTDPRTGEPTGVTVDLSRALAQRLEVEVDLVVFEQAGHVFDAADSDAWDIGYLAVDPVRAAQVAFTAPYVLISGNYLVRAGSKVMASDDMDRTGHRIALAKGSGYDLFLTRNLKAATIERAANDEGALEQFLVHNMTAVAGVREAMLALASRNAGGLRVIEPGFMEIQQAMVTKKDRPAGAAWLRAFVEEMKASGFVAASLTRANQTGASVAPPAGQ